MSDASESTKGYRYLKLVISHAVCLYHRLPISYRDVQELLFKRGIDVSHETVRAWCAKFGPYLAEALRLRKSRHGRVWHLDETRIVLGGVTHWLWRAINEYGEVLDVLLQQTRCKKPLNAVSNDCSTNGIFPSGLLPTDLRVMARSFGRRPS